MITKEVKSVLNLPDYYHDEIYLTPMISYWCIIKPLLKISKPGSICEIGAERGITSKKLSSFCKGKNISLYIVDPSGVEINIKKSKNIMIYKERSNTFLSRNIPVDFYFIDGDHNYETVMMELEMALNNNKRKSPIFLIHDVSWPCASRNLYFDYKSNNFKIKQKIKTNVALSIETNELSEIGLPIKPPYSAAINYGGSRNGVLRAVEDFQKSKDNEKWFFWKIPNLSGLGVLFNISSLPDSKSIKMIDFLTKINTLKPLLSILEANRLHILHHYFKLQKIIEKSTKERKIEQLYIKELESRLEDLSNNWKEQQSYISSLESRLKNNI